MNPYLELTGGQVALAVGLVLINGLISVALRLRLERSLLMASVRCVVQLLLVGLVLQWVFRLDRWYIVLGLAAVMTLIAGWTAVGRPARRYPGMRWHSVMAIWLSTWLVTGYALFLIFSGTAKWYQPQYAITLLGMVLGNTLNGVSVGLATFTESLTRRRDEVETALALGATRWEAGRGVVQHAVATGMLPIINSMMVVGLVSLPGMMTGQLVSGMPPIEAVKYQIVILFLIASATAMGTCGAVLAAFFGLFSAEHQFCGDRLVAGKRK